MILRRLCRELRFKIDMDWRNNYAFTTYAAYSDGKDFQGGATGFQGWGGGEMPSPAVEAWHSPGVDTDINVM